MSARTAKYHCTPCLEGRHRTCSLVIPEHWDGATASSRCVCQRCSARHCAAQIVTRQPERGTRRQEGQRRNRPGGGRPVSVWTEAKLRELLRLSAQGLTSRQVGEQVGASADTVRKYLGVARRSLS